MFCCGGDQAAVAGKVCPSLAVRACFYTMKCRRGHRQCLRCVGDGLIVASVCKSLALGWMSRCTPTAAAPRS